MITVSLDYRFYIGLLGCFGAKHEGCRERYIYLG
jgi:hypothetical protein